MDRFLHSSFPFPSCKQSTFQLACAWIIGLIAGAFPAGSTQCSSPQGTFTLVAGSTVAVQLVIVLLPLLFSVLAVYIGRPVFVLAIATVKAFLFTYVGIGILLSCGKAGWLLQLLIMFSDTLILPILWMFWHKVLDGQQILHCSMAAAIPTLAVACLDFYIISPVLANLL